VRFWFAITEKHGDFNGERECCGGFLLGDEDLLEHRVRLLVEELSADGA
jgi:hypothetical protein